MNCNPVVPKYGDVIEINRDGVLSVPDMPIIPFIEGDGVGPDIWKIARRVFDAAVEKAYGNQKRIVWMEVYAGEKSWRMSGEDNKAWLPQETVDALRKYIVSIKGPMTTPIGEGIRSINVALRQQLDLYVCLRPVRYFTGVPAPVKHPERVDMVIFRENTEDIYAGIEVQWDSPEAERMRVFLEELGLLGKVCFPKTSSFGVKPVSKEGTERLIRAAIQYAIDHDRDTVTIVHKGNIMKYTEGSFRNWGYALAKKEFGASEIDGGSWCAMNNPHTNKQIILNDVIADAFLQNVLLRPEEYSVIATMNLNGDYISDALAAQVGGIGIAPGANINYHTGLAIFEATHGTAPKYANQDRINPSSVILSGEMMLRYLGWTKAANYIIQGLEKAILSKKVTFDFARQMENAIEIKCSEFGDEIIRYM